MRHEFIDMLINNIRLIHSLTCKLGTKKKKKMSSNNKISKY